MSKKPQSFANLANEFFRRQGLKRNIQRAEVVLLWPRVVGPDLAKFSTASRFKDEILYVQVPDSETATHLTIQRQKFIDVYKVQFGVKMLRDIRFQVGPHKPILKPVSLKKKQTPVDPQALSEMSKNIADMNLTDELTQPTLKLGRALLAQRARYKAQGWQPCVTCGVLASPLKTPVMCPVCTRYSQTPGVKRAMQSLCVQPDAAVPYISEDERAVAAYQAMLYLEEQLRSLLPHVLAEPDYKPHLEHAARCYLAHLLHKPLSRISEADFDKLDPRIARVLGRW